MLKPRVLYVIKEKKGGLGDESMCTYVLLTSYTFGNTRLTNKGKENVEIKLNRQTRLYTYTCNCVNTNYFNEINYKINKDVIEEENITNK